MIKKYTNSILKDDYGIFGWTEVIRNHSLEDIMNDCQEYINNIIYTKLNLINEKA